MAELALCEKRHPKICKYFRDYKRCKFTVGCMYKHKIFHEIFENIEKKLEKVTCNHSDKENQKSKKRLRKKWEGWKLPLSYRENN